METIPQFATRLSQASVKKTWSVHAAFDWPDALDDEFWAMTPELVSLHGTDVWDALDEPARRRVAFYEVANFFSFVLHGERPLIEGMAKRLYVDEPDLDIVEYMHHFLEEENRHMVMFAEFCKRYAGKIYPEKKISLSREWAAGEEDVAFFTKVLVVEEVGDYYNVVIAADARVDPIVRQVNDFHHRDEARHIAFGRRYLRDLFERNSKEWSEETLAGFRAWLAAYLRSSWRDFYNPSVYRDAGLEDAFHVRETALASPAGQEHRTRASAKLVDLFLDCGMLLERPEL